MQTVPDSILTVTAHLLGLALLLTGQLIQAGDTDGAATTASGHPPPAQASKHALQYAPGPGAKAVQQATTSVDLLVTSTADAGEGSLRQAIITANARPGPDTIRFDSSTGPFATPQTIKLGSLLPEISDELTIDGYIEGRLWKPSGVTVSGVNEYQVFTVAPGARVRIESLTVADGHAPHGGAIANRGDLVVRGVTLVNNAAEQDGGALANLGGTVTVINSTWVDNQAGNAGGALLNQAGELTVTHCTFTGNRAGRGGALFSTGSLLLRNTILANSAGVSDCESTGTLDPRSSHNLIETNNGCGQPFSTADPRLGTPGGYNGPTRTIPLRPGSPAINRGDNASAVDEQDRPLKWDQRGNGDPRFAAGIADIGAFEVQTVTLMSVDTLEDTDVRGCTRSGRDCSLRGAITLANATPEHVLISFDPKIFSAPQGIIPTQPLPAVTADLTLDAGATGEVTLRGKYGRLDTAPDVTLNLKGVVLDASD